VQARSAQLQLRFSDHALRYPMARIFRSSYSMDNLLNLITLERARELRFQAGSPPVIVFRDEQHPLEGPPVDPEATEDLLRSIATTRQMRELNHRGAVTFIYHFQGRSPFLVQARKEEGKVAFAVR
jgi:Tfp pilus assembly pilus retraction ATPase PilT